MSRNLDKSLKDIFPATPPDFTRALNRALKNLPDHRAHWRIPALAVTAATVAALALCAVLFSNYGFSAKDIVNPAGKPTGSAVKSTANPNGPVQMLPIAVMNKAPSSAQGWQVAAVSGDVTWYFQKSSSKLARSEGGKFITISLDLSLAQELDAYTCLADDNGRWLAFTVHGNGDTVWVVTKDGRKIIVPDNVKWIAFSGQSLQADFSGAALAPYSNKEIFTLPDGADGYTPLNDSISITATFPDGALYLITVCMDTGSGYGGCLLNDRRGLYSSSTSYMGSGQTIVNDHRGMYPIGKDASGKYTIKVRGNPVQIPLQSDQFSLFKLTYNQPWLSIPIHALLIYADDPTHTLWEINIETGQAQKIASNCLAADWVDASTYWYAAQADSATAKTGAASPTNAVLVHAMMMIGNTADEPDKISVSPSLAIENLTGADVTIPAAVPCSLKISRDGTELWSQNGSHLLYSKEPVFVYDNNGAGTEYSIGPVTLHPGEIIEIELPSIPYDAPGNYAFTGYFYNDNPINCSISVSNNQSASYKLDITGALDAEGRLSVKIANNSPTDIAFPQPIGSSYSEQYPPTVCYRLLKDGTQVKNGTLPLALNPLTGKNGVVPAGGSYTLVEPGAVPCFASLPAGNYRLECLLETSKDDEKYQWGAVLGEQCYFNVTFTVPAK